ncbi:hypothetical protein PRIPAC_87025 [Pristionchus pacificus]|uniref:3'(2'),5'-bisphosphate nucleotidase n=1 Tax=Pristionchus pacificus TaxID=54126 RepID=A0A2A6BLU5_PRIPA|nr:hypothetical protein PRIPAC_87025 [Pristionchus pacificus]|eukprot:PDM66741.1 hypothetical protein PRIPAC_48158 [Pristionchus pacificus]
MMDTVMDSWCIQEKAQKDNKAKAVSARVCAYGYEWRIVLSLNDDTRTARHRDSSNTRTANLISSKSTSIENLKTANEGSLSNYSLSLDELQQILGLDAVQAVLKKFKDNPSAFMKRARNRSRHRSTVSSTSSTNVPEKGVNTARSIESLARPEEGVFTAQEIDDGVIYTARSDGIRGLKYLYSDRSNIDTARDKDGFDVTEDNFTETKGWKWGNRSKSMEDMRSRASPATSINGYFNTAVSDHPTAISHRDGVITARRYKVIPYHMMEYTVFTANHSLVWEEIGRESIRCLPFIHIIHFRRDDTACNIGSPYKATGDMRSRIIPSSCEKTPRSERSSTTTGVYGNQFGPVGGDMRSRAQPASSCERTANSKTSSTSTAVYGNEFGPVGGDMRSRAQPASSCERTADSKT